MAATYNGKVLVVGDQGVGKSSFVELISYHYFARRRPSQISFVSTFGPLDFEFHEIAEHESVASSPIATQADGAFILFDVNARNPFENVLRRYYDIVRVCGEIPAVLCGNKADGNDRSASGLQVRLDRNVVLPCFTISCRCIDSEEETLYDPFVWLVRKLAGPALGVETEEDIVLISQTWDSPPMGYGGTMTIEQIAQIEAMNAAAAAPVPLPEEDDEL